MFFFLGKYNLTILISLKVIKSKIWYSTSQFYSIFFKTQHSKMLKQRQFSLMSYWLIVSLLIMLLVVLITVDKVFQKTL